MARTKRKATLTSKLGSRPLAQRVHPRLGSSSSIGTVDRRRDQRGSLTNVLLGGLSTDEAQTDVDDNASIELVKANHSSSPEQEALEFVRYSLEQFSEKLDPLAQLPVLLDRFQEHLASFCLLY